MPQSFDYAYSDTPSSMPRLSEILIGKSVSLNVGDVLAVTTNATFAINSVPALRQLLAADKTAHYKQGTPVAGIAGIAKYSAGSNATGQVNSNPQATQLGGVVYNFPSLANGIPNEQTTNQTRIQFYEWHPSNIFVGKLDATSAVGTQALRDTLAGLILTTVNGVTTWTLDTNAAALDQCVRIVEPDESDPLYLAGGVGGRVFFAPLQTFNQINNGVFYTAQ